MLEGNKVYGYEAYLPKYREQIKYPSNVTVYCHRIYVTENGGSIIGSIGTL